MKRQLGALLFVGSVETEGSGKPRTVYVHVSMCASERTRLIRRLESARLGSAPPRARAKNACSSQFFRSVLYVRSFVCWLLNRCVADRVRASCFHAHTHACTTTHTHTKPSEVCVFQPVQNAVHMKYTHAQKCKRAARLLPCFVRAVSSADRLLSCGGSGGATLFVYVRK